MKKEDLETTVAHVLLELHRYVSTREESNPKKGLVNDGTLFKSKLTDEEKSIIAYRWLTIRGVVTGIISEWYPKQVSLAFNSAVLGDRYFGMSADQNRTVSDDGNYSGFHQALKKGLLEMAHDAQITQQRNPLTQFFTPKRSTKTTNLLRELAMFDPTIKSDPHNYFTPTM